MKIPKAESKTVEFKKSFNQDAIESLVAFANADGGSVYVGVRDDGKVLGVQLVNESETAWVNEIKSKTAPGGLSGGLPVADLLADRYATKARNPEIAELFRCAGLTERYGSGIKRIMMACKTHGYVDVEFQNLESWFRVVLRKTGDGDFTKPLEKTDVGKALQKSSLKSSLKSTLKILEILAEEPTCTYDELAEKLGVSRRAITKQIKNLREEGKLRRIGPDKGGHWEVVECEDD